MTKIKAVSVCRAKKGVALLVDDKGRLWDVWKHGSGNMRWELVDLPDEPEPEPNPEYFGNDEKQVAADLINEMAAAKTLDEIDLLADRAEGIPFGKYKESEVRRVYADNRKRIAPKEVKK